MNIIDVYERYKIMPQLQLHQLRVAAVAKIICDNFEGELDEQAIITACLLHDMGNIIKFDLTVFPEYNEPLGLEYWQAVKQEFLDKYKDSDEHVATHAIAAELGISPEAMTKLEAVGFSKSIANAAGSDYGAKIADYSDMRVGPHGILSLEDRLEESRIRYARSKVSDDRNEYVGAFRQMEKQIFTHCSIRPEDITDEACAPIIEELKSYGI